MEKNPSKQYDSKVEIGQMIIPCRLPAETVICATFGGQCVT